MGFLFNAGALGLLNGSIEWSNDTIKARLVEATDVLDEDATAMTGIGIAGNDVTLSNLTGPTKDEAGDRITFGAGNPTFVAQPAGDPVDRIVIFKFDTDDAGSTPIACVDIDEVTPNGGDITVAFAGGIVFALHTQPE